ncbi:hypothetical protein E2562_023247, partial [Oryza meyeriana var. granulata]
RGKLGTSGMTAGSSVTSIWRQGQQHLSTHVEGITDGGEDNGTERGPVFSRFGELEDCHVIFDKQSD